MCLDLPLGLGQPPDQHDELLRLEYSALLSVEQGDFFGAALTMGKAALLSSLLSKETQSNHSIQRHLIQENLYRTREQIYRAYALFQQSGEAFPVPSAVCMTLTQGNLNANQANQDLDKIENLSVGLEEIKTEIQEWALMIKELQIDFHCSVS